ncbi:hypothetical protein LSH36_10g12015 [Paralvinella palmiformis]|uniref:Amine oxidase domain-containing protein n=1 Tax=Paralvinella palmiformis TaxID=53620 RepID=A0AAD9NI62_9ANNE|nr:hypothetical protein LSH36_10g12015 [Paralvinella palmiformis]
MFMRAMENILIVGAGLTGAVTAALIKKHLPGSCQLTVRSTVWEKTDAIGGRMTTIQNPLDPRCTVDLGAQYISTEPKNFNANNSIYEELLNNGLLKPLNGQIEGDRIWPEGTQHFVSPHGIYSVIEYYLKKAEARLEMKHHLKEIHQENSHYVVKTSDGTIKAFDGVILTMPVPDILQLEGIIPKILDQRPDVRERLKAVQYSSRFAMGLYYKPGTIIDVPWVAKYFHSDPVIVFIAADSKKREQEDKDIGPSLLVHASVQFTLKHIHEDVDQVCTEHILPRVHELLPQLPKSTFITNHLWQVSQVYKGYEGKPGMLILQDKPLLMCGGDTFTDSQFNRCLESAELLSRMVVKNIV